MMIYIEYCWDMIWVRKLMGWVLVGMAAYFIRPVLPGQWGTILLALVALAAGVHLSEPEPEKKGILGRLFGR